MLKREMTEQTEITRQTEETEVRSDDFRLSGDFRLFRHLSSVFGHIREKLFFESDCR
jgi:hypothetical protein